MIRSLLNELPEAVGGIGMGLLLLVIAAYFVGAWSAVL